MNPLELGLRFGPKFIFIKMDNFTQYKYEKDLSLIQSILATLLNLYLNNYKDIYL